MSETTTKAFELAAAQDQLVNQLRKFESCVVAFSGGVDSAVVAKAAQLALGEHALAVTGTSASLAEGELTTARQVAESIGIRHEVVATDELADDAYLANAPDRCFHCKTELYGLLSSYATKHGFACVVAGANLDDLGDFRPGLQAASNHEVVNPLADCGLAKDHVRQLAKAWDLKVWDKPATPCLSSRVVYGLEITPERLARIDAAEQLLRRLGLATVRVRCHQDELARLEVPVDELPRLCEPQVREQLVTELRQLGFGYVTLDLEGFRSGSFQQLVPVEQLLAAKG
ncbi:ATP-dependent sacrificial sulfur transferase LarE [Adhaeretor mobilis]|uniref:GMP synthase subunit B n=1 Tax=Adhaeretor mobilis TaxID=1930276 RepID=A0A517MXT8_9BACT|nr:ATP-dependent sacrificial sulfur transferase LarE [Adhaeretor mobilis]QDS99695.1 GMP synthase subunit B [Adhaeretor mobilis]